MRYLMAFIIFLTLSSNANAEIVRGAMDCKITNQLYQKIDENGLIVSDAQPRGDKIGATLRLRYEFDRATPALPWRLKTEFGRMAVLFDAKFPPKNLNGIDEDGKMIGFKAHSTSQEVTAFFTDETIILATQNNKATFIHKGDGAWSALYTENRSNSRKPPSNFGLMIGFDCYHETDAIKDLTSLLP